MGNMHNYRYRFLRGVYRYKVFGALTKRVLPTLVDQRFDRPSCTLCACMHIPIYLIYICTYYNIYTQDFQEMFFKHTLLQETFLAGETFIIIY